MDYVLLFISTLFSTGRSMLMKGASSEMDNKGRFYFSQTLFFGMTALIAFFVTLPTITEILPLTVYLGLAYGVFFIISQWCYTLALKQGPASICVMIYSFGFIFPTIAGPIFWNDTFTFFKGLGILLVFPAILLTVKPDPAQKKGSKRYFIPLFAAMCASGALGIMQKIQQNSPAAGQTPAFLMVGALTAAVASAFMVLLRTKAEGKAVVLPKKSFLFSSLAGVCFAVINLLNITLVGRMSSAVFFPMLNVTCILLSLMCGVVLFKEKPRKEDYLAFTIGIVSIMVLNL